LYAVWGLKNLSSICHLGITKVSFAKKVFVSIHANLVSKYLVTCFAIRRMSLEITSAVMSLFSPIVHTYDLRFSGSASLSTLP